VSVRVAKEYGGTGCAVVVTRAGEHSILDHLTGEVMHPVGRVESDTLYVAPARLAERLCAPGPTPLVLLDVGLGMASNALAALRVAHQLPLSARPLEIVSVDHSLQPLALALSDEHAESFGLTGLAAEAARSLLTHPERPYRDARVTWRLHLSDLASALASEAADAFDVVFWDIYSPRSLPQFWTEQSFRALRRVCRAGATVHTYSGALAVRTAMLLAGFAVGLGPSSGGKQRHTTIGAVDLADLERPLGKEWLTRVAAARGRAEIELSDADYQRLVQLPQFG
jgi:tRNA U34 5-methylaminomethyl-2-thiouridine-forming methyltransferase MnmC